MNRDHRKKPGDGRNGVFLEAISKNERPVSCRRVAGRHSFAQLNHALALAQLDQLVGVQACGPAIIPAGDQQIVGAGEHLVGAVRFAPP
jgi:hypothetical protein